MRKLILLSFLPLFLWGQEPDFSWDRGDDCIQYNGAARTTGFDTVLQFRNRCPLPMYLTICVEDWRGKKTLYQSSTRIPRGGWYKKVLFDEPRAIDWAASHRAPIAPESCQGVKK